DTTNGSSDFRIEGRSYERSQDPIAYFIRASPDYFTAIGTRLRSGRYFSDSDIASSSRVALINETLERQFFSGEDPIGKRLNTGTVQQPEWNQIVGVIGDVKYNG